MSAWLLLVRTFPRVARWLPMVPTALLAAGLLVWVDYRDGSGLLWPLRGCAALLALGAAYTLDDSAAAVTAAAPTSLAVRRGTRLAVVVGAVGIAWAALASYAAVLSGDPLPLAALTLELAALLALVLAFAAAVGGTAAGPAVVGVLVLSTRLPQRWSLLDGVPGDVSWSAAHRRWVVLLVAAVAVLLVATRDPAARPLLRRT